MHVPPDDWVARPTTAFDSHVGPLLFPPGAEDGTCGFLADERHTNKWGVVHGGMLTTAMDVALGIRSRVAAGHTACATVQLVVQFVSAVKIGEFALVRPELIRVTRSLVFTRGLMVVGDRTIASAEGVFKLFDTASDRSGPKDKK